MKRRFLSVVAALPLIILLFSGCASTGGAYGTSSSASFFFNRGSTLLDRQEYESAIADFTEAIRLDPNNAAAYNNRGVAYYYKGDIDKAIAGYEAALRIDPNYTLARNNLENARQAQWGDDPPPPGNFIPYDDTGDPWPDAPDL
jgi:tetratricopeptide (TPR) repeat protein